MNHLEFGAHGERLAAEYLAKRGWRIYERNVRAGAGEIDIVAYDGEELVIVEVRTRRIGRLMPSETSVGPRKIRNLVNAARIYVDAKRYQGNWRIDVAAVTLEESGEWRIELFSDVTS